ncbi:MAG: ribonucleoside-diphosphate reductase subunit alpha [Gammaproteobacteria bacterium]|jgi:ribonucleoside-diphosphate reductase alpha chain|nr:ribonucleoside-diphosphate reductase subunit alpha [Gammaproteobacteria bacterium]MBT4462886.1 ribonucleoside-diphosphate reductase subunit alpha [Gammaproteobacteria bacterium]MBT4655388.1 ribonucleoside-diphosphate reductase subunit alpha [Gammaproteobacteria bacterium]MBT5116322.1 ribonucleoside-diphosphate reductase subunit alpha [Gammaproteobacteria bacterium]MBT5761377.1 ribonucleoside-diphosphate reductase subunit alpha [Gammaproteobacteria bacterium]
MKEELQDNIPSGINEKQIMPDASSLSPIPGKYRVMRRNGKVTSFDLDKISLAMTKAFLSVEGSSAAASTRIHNEVESLAQKVNSAINRRFPEGGVIHIEDIQDQVELAIMRAGYQDVARAYVIYREERSQARNQNIIEKPEDLPITKGVLNEDGSTQALDLDRLRLIIEEACTGVEDVSAQMVFDLIDKNIYDGIKKEDLSSSILISIRPLIEKDPNYSYVVARLLLNNLYEEALSFLNFDENTPTFKDMSKSYPAYFKSYLGRAVELELVDKELLTYDIDYIAKHINPAKDLAFTYLGLQTLYDRYFIHHREQRFELPQAFFMRVAMGLAINEKKREERTVEFYNLISSFDFMCSTPTLFNSGTLRPQLSSCYLSTLPDDLKGIFEGISDDAMLSKFAGGLGNDWSQVRALGSHIKGTNGQSQGVIPFLKVANDTAVAVNQGGKRKGAMCAYLETWHLDIEQFLELRKNTGDDRRRTHDMNTANWIPDLFMKRLHNDMEWTLFSPHDCPELHDLTGLEFENKYEEYEKDADEGKISNFKRLKAVDLWRKILSMLFETGHPWITFKDPCNLRSPQQHVGVVHSSNLCTEITLNTSKDEIAVCNLGSVNLAAHIDEDKNLDVKKLEKTIRTAMRMLDNVIDYNYYSVKKAQDSNAKHRPVGLGLMGFQDALYKLRIPYGSEEAVNFADTSMEQISYFALRSSMELSKERGPYQTFDGSLWSQGILPIDSLRNFKKVRGKYLDVNMNQTLDWDTLREEIKKNGMRNSNSLAIAPTATISNICGVAQSIEPTYQNLYVKSNLSGEFTVINPYLIKDFKDANIWDEVMIKDLKYFDGQLSSINRIPDELKSIYQTCFEIDTRWLVEAAARRQKWIDQSQSLNLYIPDTDGKKLDSAYKLAWIRGLKTTYYLRSLGATHVEKSTSDNSGSKLNAVSSSAEVKQCLIDEPDCEACQ